jgi:hypothetical protein
VAGDSNRLVPIGGTLVLDPLTSIVLTVLVVVFTVNAVNFVVGWTTWRVGSWRCRGRLRLWRFLLSVEFGFQRATRRRHCALLLGSPATLPHNMYPARNFG